VERSVVLVTGMSGTGKSAVLEALSRRGHRVVDTDDPGWIVGGSGRSEPLWDLDRVGALVDRHDAGWLFVAGCVANQGALYDRFDAVVLLSAPLDVILGRVARRANPSGRRLPTAPRSRATRRRSSPACAPAPTSRSSPPCLCLTSS
jgi:broad-specificity NMP kinase